MQSQLPNLLTKVKKIASTKGKYKYRERFNFCHCPQLKSMNYDVKKRLAEKQQQKLQKQPKEESGTDSDEDSPQAKSKSSVNSNIKDFATWKAKNGIDQRSKVYIVKGGYKDLRDALDERGWYENSDYFSPFFDLKWTCKQVDIDFGSLKDNQIVNHFDNNVCCTSKFGLTKSLRTLIYLENQEIHQNYPRCFDLGDLGDFEDFVENYRFTQVRGCPHLPRNSEPNCLSLWQTRTGTQLALSCSPPQT